MIWFLFALMCVHLSTDANVPPMNIDDNDDGKSDLNNSQAPVPRCGQIGGPILYSALKGERDGNNNNNHRKFIAAQQQQQHHQNKTESYSKYARKVLTPQSIQSVGFAKKLNKLLC